MALVNRRQLIKEFIPQLPIIKKQVNKIVNNKFEENKKQMIEKFDGHLVTQEIRAGSQSGRDANISGTLRGIGNLFAFIGFSRGSRPIQSLRNLLIRETNLNFVRFSKSRPEIQYSISVPNNAEITNATPLPWSPGRSWALEIETGISGLGQFLRGGKFKQSRSGGGIQSKKRVRSARFSPPPGGYLTGIFASFFNQFK